MKITISGTEENCVKIFIAWAQIKQIEFEVEGMKVANIEREHSGYALAYSEETFVQASKDMNKIVDDLKELIGGDNDSSK